MAESKVGTALLCSQSHSGTEQKILTEGLMLNHLFSYYPSIKLWNSLASSAVESLTLTHLSSIILLILDNIYVIGFSDMGANDTINI